MVSVRGDPIMAAGTDGELTTVTRAGPVGTPSNS